MPNFFYIAKEKELILDCDKGFSHIDAEHILRIIEREWVLYGSIGLVNFSSTVGHFHVVIKLDKEISKSMAMAISIMLGSDRHREILAYGQFLAGWVNPWLVVAPARWKDREPDHVCNHANWRKCKCLRLIQNKQKVQRHIVTPK